MNSTVDRSPFSSNKHVLDVMNVHLNEDQAVSFEKRPLWHLDYADLARLDRFQNRTLFTMGTPRTASVFRKEMVYLACTHRFIMHLVQSVAASHDRFLSGSATSRATARENYHMCQGILGFQSRLSRPIRPEDRDSLFIAASLLGVVTFFTMEADSIEDVWPLKESDMAWINLSSGKQAIWRLTKPSRRDSMWRPMSDLYERDLALAAKLEPPRPVLSVFDHLCSDDGSLPSAAANPYHRTAQLLITLLDLECDDSTWLRFLLFICHVEQPFKDLLEHKDPWALLMLAYWFMKICRGVWWVSSRAILQGQAICIYLERYYADDTALQIALVRPRLEFEAAQREGRGGISAAVHKAVAAQQIAICNHAKEQVGHANS